MILGELSLWFLLLVTGWKSSANTPPPSYLPAVSADGKHFQPLIEGVAQPLLIAKEDSFLLGGAISSSQLQDMMKLLEEELRLYPSGLLQFAHVHKVTCCSNLHLGYSGYFSSIGGLAAHSRHTIFMNGEQIGEYTSQAFHHELFHMIDSRFARGDMDSEWEQLNEPGFSYASSYFHKLPNNESGFVTPYAKTHLSEDKAETFAWMVYYPKELALLAAYDRVVDRKVKCLKQRLFSICPEMNDAYWIGIQDAQNRRRSKPASSQTGSSLQLAADPQADTEPALIPQARPARPTTTPEPPEVLHTALGTLSGPIKLLLIVITLLFPPILVAVAHRKRRRVLA